MRILDWWRDVTSTPFVKRNPIPIGAIGLALVGAMLVTAFNPALLPFVGGGTTYTAYFSEAAGLRAGDEVRIAGVKVGKVGDVALDGDKVKATFQVKGSFVGDESLIGIEIKTVLGAKLLAIDSLGEHAQDPDETIPASRTTAPYDIYPALTQLATTIGDIDTTRLAQAFDTIGTTLSGTPDEVGAVVRGLTRLSQTISSRDAQLKQLLASANAVTGVLAARDAELQRLLGDGSLLLDALHSRREAIHSLLVNTTTLSVELQGIVADNAATLGPLLDELDRLLALLKKNQDSLDRGIALLGPYYRLMNNVVGNGRWFDNYIQNLSATGIAGWLG